MDAKIEVAIGILTDAENRLLVGRRMRAPQRGKWEMPGGKVEAGETVEEALRREFDEEGGIALESIARWTRIESESHVLHLFRVYATQTFVPTIYQEFRYVDADEIPALDWIASNRSFVGDLRAILKTLPAVDSVAYFPKDTADLSQIVDEVTLAFHSRNRFRIIACFLDCETTVFPMDEGMESKLALLYHEGVRFHAIGNPTIPLPSYIEFPKRGTL